MHESNRVRTQNFSLWADPEAIQNFSEFNIYKNHVVTVTVT